MPLSFSSYPPLSRVKSISFAISIVDVSAAYLLIEGFADIFETARIGVLRFARTPRRTRQLKPMASHRLRIAHDRDVDNSITKRDVILTGRRPTADPDGMAWSRLVDWSEAKGNGAAQPLNPTSQTQLPSTIDPPDRHAERGVDGQRTGRSPPRRTMAGQRPRGSTAYAKNASSWSPQTWA